MRKLFLTFALLASFAMSAQAFLSTSRYYTASVVSSNDNTINFKFYVSSTGSVYQVGSDGKLYEPDQYCTVNNGKTTVYTWANAGGIWSESQTFIFTRNADTGEIALNYLRVVQNEGEAPWMVYGYGYVD